MSLGKRIAKLREKQNLTQKGLAEKISLTRQALSLYEIDKREPDNDTLNRLADFFGVSVDYLLGRINEPTYGNNVPTLSPNKEAYPGSIISVDNESGYAADKNINKTVFLKNKLRQLRTEKKLTQETLAKLINIKKQEYSSYEQGVIPDKVTLYRIAFHLDTTIEYLLGETDNPIPLPKKEEAYPTGGSYVYLAGSDGTHKFIPIPKEKEERFNKLVEAGMPELLTKKEVE